jgi:thymidylate synthase (FAD)
VAVGREIRLFEHGFVRLDAAMASDLSVANAARVSFAKRKEVLDESDEGLIRFLMRDRHGTPYEHNAFRFHIRCPLFVAREWFRHRVGCLTGDTVVTFLDTKGHATRARQKTIAELWSMWSQGERNGQRLATEHEHLVRELAGQGLSMRAIARQTGAGRRTVRRTIAEGTTATRDARWRVRKMKLRVLDEETNEFGVGHIADVVDQGIQPVYRVELADGKHLTMTATHRVLTTGGWCTLAEAVGLDGAGPTARATRECSLLVNGVPIYRDPEWMRSQRDRGRSVQEIADEAGCSYHTIRAWLRRLNLQFASDEHGFKAGHTPWNRGVRGYRLNRRWTEAQRRAIGERRSGKRSNFWRGGVSSERSTIGRWTTEHAATVHAQYDYRCQAPGCGRRGARLHAHHIVPVWLDSSRARDVGNLITVCAECHRRIHSTQLAELRFAVEKASSIGFAEELAVPPRRGVRLTAHAVAVVSVEYAGLQQTYDLCVDGPWHNFVANGVVVHNSFNEESARYHELEGDFYVPAPEDVRSQVGKPGAYTFERVPADVADGVRIDLSEHYERAYRLYRELIDRGLAKELARCVLPMGTFTQFYWTVNARSLMNFVSLRAAETAQLEIRRYADAVEELFGELMPVTHAAFVANGRVAP